MSDLEFLLPKLETPSPPKKKNLKLLGRGGGNKTHCDFEIKENHFQVILVIHEEKNAKKLLQAME